MIADEATHLATVERQADRWLHLTRFLQDDATGYCTAISLGAEDALYIEFNADQTYTARIVSREEAQRLCDSAKADFHSN